MLFYVVLRFDYFVCQELGKLNMGQGSRYHLDDGVLLFEGWKHLEPRVGWNGRWVKKGGTGGCQSLGDWPACFGKFFGHFLILLLCVFVFVLVSRLRYAGLPLTGPGPGGSTGRVLCSSCHRVSLDSFEFFCLRYVIMCLFCLLLRSAVEACMYDVIIG